MSTPAEQTPVWPERYEIHRRGTPDPDNSALVVLDVVNDFCARVALRMLVRSYRTMGRDGPADTLEALLATTQDAVATRAKNINEATRTTTKTTPRTTTKRTSRRALPMS